MNNKILLWCILIITFFNGFQSFALAQEELTPMEIASLMNLELEELMNIKIVSASKVAQKVLEAPSSVTVFSRQELLAMGITSIEELLNFVPGFQSTREVIYNQGYRVVSRGQSTPQTSYNILFMIDGERLNTDVTGGALGLNHFITLANVKQVEVIRGPGSALYGTGAFTGIVNIITMTEGNEVFVSGGNLKSQEAYTNLSHQYADWKISLFARHFEDDGQAYRGTYLANDPSTTSAYDPRRGDDAYLTVDWRERLSLKFRHTERHLDDFLDGRNVFFAGINYFDSQQQGLSLKYQLLNTAEGKVTVYGNYSTAELEQASGNRNKNNTIQETSVAKEYEWRFGVDGNYRLSTHHELLAGLEWRRPTVTKRHFFNRDFVTGEMVDSLDDREPEREILGVYLQDQYRVNETLEATMGMRYDRYSDFGSTTNPRLALVYAATPVTKFKLMYGQAFRAPSFQQFWTIRLGNPDLRPETVKTAEFAWTQQYSKVQTTLTYFRSRTKDRIDTVLKPPATRIFANISSLDTEGWELEASTKLDKLFMRLAYTYLTKTVERPQNVSKQMLSAIANYQEGPWNFNVNGYYHSEMEQDILTTGGGTTLFTMAGYWVWNSALRYNWNKHLTVVGRIHNLADTEFASPTKTPSFTEGLPNRGRAYSLGIEVQF